MWRFVPDMNWKAFKKKLSTIIPACMTMQRMLSSALTRYAGLNAKPDAKSLMWENLLRESRTRKKMNHSVPDFAAALNKKKQFSCGELFFCLGIIGLQLYRVSCIPPTASVENLSVNSLSDTEISIFISSNAVKTKALLSSEKWHLAQTKVCSLQRRKV